MRIAEAYRRSDCGRAARQGAVDEYIVSFSHIQLLWVYVWPPERAEEIVTVGLDAQCWEPIMNEDGEDNEEEGNE